MYSTPAVRRLVSKRADEALARGIFSRCTPTGSRLITSIVRVPDRGKHPTRFGRESSVSALRPSAPWDFRRKAVDTLRHLRETPDELTSRSPGIATLGPSSCTPNRQLGACSKSRRGNRSEVTFGGCTPILQSACFLTLSRERLIPTDEVWPEDPLSRF